MQTLLAAMLTLQAPLETMEQQQKTNEMMMERQRKANKNQARLQEQMAKKDVELSQVQR